MSAALLVLALSGLAAGARVVTAATGGQEAGGGQPPAPPESAYGVGVRVLTFTDPSRRIRLTRTKSERRTLVTYVRYPVVRGASAGSPPAHGPFPLVVFAHGFGVTPATYARLLDSWTRAGYVVAAPVFPLTSANAPGGPNEDDVVNQPADVSFVISSLLALAARPGPLDGLIDPTHVAVAGQSDGGETALAVADSRRYRDRRVRAAIVLSGAELSGIGGYSFAGGPALLAVQGTRDASNQPRFTRAFFHSARAPKYLLWLLGAGHLPPYTTERSQLGLVERVTREFLDGELEGDASELAGLGAVANVPGTSILVSEP